METLHKIKKQRSSTRRKRTSEHHPDICKYMCKIHPTLKFERCHDCCNKSRCSRTDCLVKTLTKADHHNNKRIREYITTHRCALLKEAREFILKNVLLDCSTDYKKWEKHLDSIEKKLISANYTIITTAPGCVPTSFALQIEKSLI